MRIAVFGATGQTGIHLIDHGLRSGHLIWALVKNEKKLEDIKSKQLHVEKIDVLRTETFKKHLIGIDAVVSCLDCSKMKVFSVAFYADAIKQIVTAMREIGVKRLICMSLANADESGHGSYLNHILQSMHVLHKDGIQKMESYLQNECDDIDYTIVRVQNLSGGSNTENEDKRKQKEKTPVTHLDVAKFLLYLAESNDYVKEIVETSDIEQKL